MTKYSVKFKMNVIHEYLEGKGGVSFLAKKHGIKSYSQIQRWINNYQEFGVEGLLRNRQNKNYSVQFKLDAIKLYQTSEMSYREVANVLGITNSPMITSWIRKFRDKGIDGLSKPKGHPTKMSIKKINKTVNKDSINKSQNTDKERIKELEKQVRTLQIQNAFLKELRTLRKQEAQKRTK